MFRSTTVRICLTSKFCEVRVRTKFNAFSTLAVVCMCVRQLVDLSARPSVCPNVRLVHNAPATVALCTPEAMSQSFVLLFRCFALMAVANLLTSPSLPPPYPIITLDCFVTLVNS